VGRSGAWEASPSSSHGGAHRSGNARSPLRHWPAEIDRILIEGVGFAEVALFVKQANLVVLTDLVLNLEAPKLPLLFRPAARLAGVLAPGGKAPLYLRALIRFKGRQARPSAANNNFEFARGRYNCSVVLRELRSSRWL
jgi:hypothetical protein